MFAVGAFFYYNHNIWQFFVGLIFADFQKIAKSDPQKLPNSMIIEEKTREHWIPRNLIRRPTAKNRLPRKKVVLQYFNFRLRVILKHVMGLGPIYRPAGTERVKKLLWVCCICTVPSLEYIEFHGSIILWAA